MDTQLRLCVGRDLGPRRVEASDPQEGEVGAAQGTLQRDQAQGGPRRHGAGSTSRGTWGAGCHPGPPICQPYPVKPSPGNNDGEHPSHWDGYALCVYLRAQQVLVGTDTESLCVS